MGKRAASRAPIPFSQTLKRPRTTRAASQAKISSPSSSQSLKRPRSLDDAPPEICPSSLRLKKRPRTIDDAQPPGLYSCSSFVKIPSPRAPKRKSYDLRGAQIYLDFPSWGAKRARTTHRPNNCGDWASLDDGPAGLIAELVLANDLADYIRFRAVCRPWRRCSANPRACGVLDRRFHPRGWIMVREKRANPRSRRFLNVSTGQCVQVDLRELLDHRLLQSTTEGLLVLLAEATSVVRLLNPLTRQVAELPQTPACLASEFTDDSPDSAGLADDHTILLYFCLIGTLAFAKPGDEHWVLVKTDELLMPTMSYSGRFYGIARDAVMAVEIRESLPPRLVVAAKLAKPFSRMADTVHLLDNGGKLFLVHSKIPELPDDVEDEDYYLKRKYKVYRVDLDAGKMTPAPRSLSGRAVFIGSRRALSVSPQAFPYIRADTIS